MDPIVVKCHELRTVYVDIRINTVYLAQNYCFISHRTVLKMLIIDDLKGASGSNDIRRLPYGQKFLMSNIASEIKDKKVFSASALNKIP